MKNKITEAPDVQKEHMPVSKVVVDVLAEHNKEK
jgi:hypothetical protein